MTKYSRAGVALAAVVITVGALSACSKSDTGGQSSSGVPLVHSGKLTTCTHLPYAPFQSKDASGKVVGFDVDLIDLVAKKLGVPQDIVDTPFEGIKTGQDLNAGKCDVAAAGMTITDERKKVIDFADPYFDATQALAVQAGASIKSLADLIGKKIGVQAATTGEDYINAQVKAQNLNIEVVSYKDLAAEQQALVTGQIVGAVNDLPVWNEYIKANPGKITVAAGFNTGEQYGFGVKKGNTKLLQVINEVLATSKKDGSYDKIYAQWIGPKPTS